MKVAELVKVGKACYLEHPDIGEVKWCNDMPSSGYAWCLHFIKGHDRGNPLIADSAVLFDDTWVFRGDA